MTYPAEDAEIKALFEVGEKEGCVELSEFNETVESLDLDSDEVQLIFEQLEERGIEVADDCGRDVPEQVSYGNEGLATTTTDALQLFLNEARRFPLLSPEEEVELAKRVEAGDQEAKERMVNSNLRLVVSIAKRYYGHQLSLLDLIPGRDPGTDSRDREIRLAPGIQVLDLCDVVDPRIDRARDRQPRTDHQDADPPPRAGAEDDPCRTGARDAARPRSHRR